METALPLFIQPDPRDPNWSRAARAGGSRVGFIIANVSNGPGESAHPDWTRALNDCLASSIPVYGYVSTRFAARDAAQVDAEIRKWLDLYPQISGFYFDETSAKLEHLAYYTTRYHFVKSLNPNFTVVINPCSFTPEDFMASCDVNTIFHGDYVDWPKFWPRWMPDYPESRFFAIIYSLPGEAALQQLIEDAARHRIGKIFATDQPSASAPLPEWFEQKLNLIRQQRTGQPALTLAIENVATAVTRGSAAISWQTTVRSTAIVLYGTSPNHLAGQVQQSTPSTGHWINIGNLHRKTTYYYQIIARTPDGAALASSIFSFRTMP